MSRMDLSENRFLSDYRTVNFVIDANGQKYELAIASIFVSPKITMFYTLFKPADYDHIILMSSFTQSWVKAKDLFRNILEQVSLDYGVNVQDYPEIVSFIS